MTSSPGRSCQSVFSPRDWARAPIAAASVGGDPGHDDARLVVVELRLDDRQQLPARLTRPVDELHHALAQAPVVVDAGEAEVAERQPAQ
jgi:hypothetical protein